MRCLSILSILAVSFGMSFAAPASVLDDDPFVFDNEFNWGYSIVEFTYAPNPIDRPGRRVLRLNNGDLVLAADIPLSGHIHDGTSIALTRYAPDGQHGLWSNADPQDVLWGRFLVWPTDPGSFPFSGTRHQVLDLKQVGNRILVLYARNHLLPVENQIMLDVFDIDGERITSQMVDAGLRLPRSARMQGYLGGSPDGLIHRVLVAYPHNTHLPESPQWHLKVNRYQFNPDQTTFLPDDAFHSGQNWRTYSLGGCASFSDPRHGDDLKLAASFSSPIASPRLYLANTLSHNGRQDIAVLAVNGGDSTPQASFGSGTCGRGFRVFEFNDGGEYEHRVAGIVATASSPPLLNEVIHVAANVRRDCGTSGIGLAKIDHTGAFVPSFGNQGYLFFGGATQGAQGTCPTNRPTHSPAALVRIGKRLAIAGKYATEGFLPPYDVIENPFIAIVDADSGTVGDLRTLPIQGSVHWDRVGDGAFVDMVADGVNRLAIVGDVIDERNQEVHQRATLTLLVSDRIFGDGHE